MLALPTLRPRYCEGVSNNSEELELCARFVDGVIRYGLPVLAEDGFNSLHPDIPAICNYAVEGTCPGRGALLA